MTEHIIALALVGMCTYYSDGLMETVAANRGLECAECVGMVALADCSMIGARVWVNGEGDFLVADCGTFLTPGRIAEVDYQTAIRWQMAGPVKCAVTEEPIARSEIPDRGGIQEGWQ